jgi:PAS domain-containing protein
MLLRAGFAVVLAGMALWFTLKLPAYHTQISYSFFTAAVAGSAYFAGWRAGLLTTVLTALITAWILPPPGSLAIADRGDTIRFATFVFTSLVICLTVASLHSSRQALQDARDALRLSKRRIAYVERHAKVWTWEYDLRTDRVSWSNLYGNSVSRREQSLADWLQMVHEEDRERVAEAIRRAVRKGEFEARFRIMLGDSQPRWLLGRAQLVLLDAKPAALVGINMEVSVHGDTSGGLPAVNANSELSPARSPELVNSSASIATQSRPRS